MNEQLKERIMSNVIVKFFYKLLSYFELGKGNIARFYLPIIDMLMLLSSLKILFDIQFSHVALTIIGLLALTAFIILGWSLIHFGFYKADRMQQTLNDPIAHEMYKAAVVINTNEKRRIRNPKRAKTMGVQLRLIE